MLLCSHYHTCMYDSIDDVYLVVVFNDGTLHLPSIKPYITCTNRMYITCNVHHRTTMVNITNIEYYIHHRVTMVNIMGVNMLQSFVQHLPT